MKSVTALLIFPLAVAFAESGPAKTLTAKKMQDAYTVAIKQISTMLKAPDTAHFSPIEDAVFSTGRADFTHIRMSVEERNSSGATLKKGWWCEVKPRGDEGMYAVSCFPGSGSVPKNAIRYSEVKAAELAAAPTPVAAQMTAPVSPAPKPVPAAKPTAVPAPPPVVPEPVAPYRILLPSPATAPPAPQKGGIGITNSEPVQTSLGPVKGASPTANAEASKTLHNAGNAASSSHQ